MQNKIIIITSLIVLMLLSNLKAQNWYEFSHFSRPYEPLKNPIVLAKSPFNPEDERFMVSGDFWFDFWGNRRYSMAVHTNGRIFFAEEEFFSPRNWLKDMGNSQIAYSIEGDAECRERILKIEYQNMGFDCDVTNNNFINFQVWIYERQSVIEIHYGNSSINNTDAQNCWFDKFYTSVSFYKPYNQFVALSGDPNNPTFNENRENNVLESVPPNDKVYRFQPESEILDDFVIFPIPFKENIYIQRKLSCGDFEAHLYDLAGKLISKSRKEGSQMIINTNHIPFGIYVLRLKDYRSNQVSTYRVLSINQ